MDWEDIILGGVVGTIGGMFLAKKATPAIPRMVGESLEAHKARIEKKIADFAAPVETEVKTTTTTV